MLPSTQVSQYPSNPVVSQGDQASQYQSITMVAARPNWLKGSSIAITGQPNALPKNLAIYLHKYVHEGLVIVEEHVQQFKNSFIALRVEHEDVACVLFRTTFNKHANR